MIGALLFAATAAAGALPPVTVARDSQASALQSLSASQMLSLADELLRRGSVGKCMQILDLLSRDPNPDVRNEARFRQAKILAAAHQQSRAAVLLRRILDDRPDAGPVRLELAGILDKMGDKEGAWRQLRAVQASGLPAAVARLVDRYSQALRASRPFGASFEIAVAPDSNINHATRSDTLGTIFGDFDIAKDSKAKSGTGVALNGQVFRRLALGADNSFVIRAAGLANLYRETRFNDIAVDAAAGPELRLGRSQLNLELGATQRWYGQKPYMRSERLGATWTRPVGSRMQVRLSGTAALVDNRFDDLEDGKSYSARIDLERALSATTGVGLNLGVTREALKDPGYSTAGWRAGLLAWHEIGRMTITAEAETGKLHADDRLVLFPEKRSDRYSRIALGATFRQLQFKGFAPVARFTIERNRSTIAFYDYHRVRTEMGVVRAF